jgi:hypothetical protein
MKVVQHPRGSTAWNMAYTGPQSQLTYDSDLNQYRMHDGVTPGGWLITKVADVSILGTQRFTGKLTKSVPATQLLASDKGKLLEFSVAGTYTLPDRAGIAIGYPILLKALVPAVIVQRQGGDLIQDQGTDVTDLALTANEIVTIAAQDTAYWLVTSRY